MEEQEQESGRLNAAFTWGPIEGLAQARHVAQASADGGLKMAHLFAVAELAERLAMQHFDDLDFASQVYWSRVCRAAGLLHECLHTGCVFEDVVAVSDEAVARAVASCTPDPRLPAPRRLEAHANQAGLASAAAQLVKLCDLRHEAGIRLKVARGRPDEMALVAATAWAREAHLVLPVLRKVESLVTAPQSRRLVADLDELDELLGRARKRPPRKKGAWL